MGVGSGLGAQLGIAKETVYGTAVTVDHAFNFKSETMKKVKNFVQGGGMAAGRAAKLGRNRKVTTTAAAGSITMEVEDTGMGLWFQALMGGTVVPVIVGAGPAYTQTHPFVADNGGKSLTIQVGKPQTDGTVKPFTYKGCKILSAEFSCDTNGDLMVTWEIDSRELDETITIAALVYSTTAQVISWNEIVTKIGTFGTEAQVDGIKNLSVKFTRPQNTDRFYQGNGGKKSEPITNDDLQVTGTISADFLDKAVFNDKFASDANTSLIWSFQGAALGSTVKTFEIQVPMIFLDDGTPTVDGNDIVSGDFPFTAQLDDAGHALGTIKYISADVTL